MKRGKGDGVDGDDGDDGDGGEGGKGAKVLEGDCSFWSLGSHKFKSACNVFKVSRLLF